MGGNIVSKSYKTAKRSDLEVTNVEDYSDLRNEKSSFDQTQNATGIISPDTSIPLEENRADDTMSDSEENAPWHGLPMGINEHGSFTVINIDNNSYPNHIPVKPTQEKDNKCCVGLRERCKMGWRPCLTKYNPLSEYPSRRASVKYACMCPPHGVLARVVLIMVILLLLWAILWSITGAESLPGGNLFALYILVVVAAIGGMIVEFFHLPALLGMLIVGFMLKNVSRIQIADDIDPGWASALRNIALAVILIKAGLGIDAGALRKLSLVCARLALVPCIMEAVTVAVAAHLLLGFGWDWAFMLGFVIAAVSPAVVVPSVLELQEKGYGISKGIPTLIVASASCENVFAIAAFGIPLGIAFSGGYIDIDNEGQDNSTNIPMDSSNDDTGMLVFNIFRAPIELLLGVVFGCVGGVFLWYFPDKDQKSLMWKRTLLVCGGGLLLLFGGAKADFTGAGALGCLILAFVAAQGWGRGKEPVKKVVGLIWKLFEPILFGLIGAAVSVEYLDDTVGLGIAIMAIGLAVRTAVTMLVVCKAGLNLKEKVFAALSWFPKATVQAAIGPLAWEVAINKNAGYVAEQNGIKILTLAVLSIILTAPIGAIMIALGGPRLLQKSQEGNTDKLPIPEVTVVSPEGVEEEEEERIQEEVPKEAKGQGESSSML
ncbi:sodium/hydrogen exchanger 9B2-like [Asterias rubens]|uniref:sodium/hydrogen exchanger 9B2-like n=1 Tax=Asterias rubens TaxID=7604 RepID=UPI0014557D88|nr:sodium/hydrogen exchanger 9B2-like [Asterias rubens]XP_033644452.1 sodium/hydrogen exchanger 9B2-like [Asterias rubens]XP_033644454.1 sodium/hydrogen exchanger 9B2-like [Asterias rubens]